MYFILCFCWFLQDYSSALWLSSAAYTYKETLQTKLMFDSFPRVELIWGLIPFWLNFSEGKTHQGSIETDLTEHILKHPRAEVHLFKVDWQDSSEVGVEESHHQTVVPSHCAAEGFGVI